MSPEALKYQNFVCDLEADQAVQNEIFEEAWSFLRRGMPSGTDADTDGSGWRSLRDGDGWSVPCPWEMRMPCHDNPREILMRPCTPAEKQAAAEQVPLPPPPRTPAKAESERISAKVGADILVDSRMALSGSNAMGLLGQRSPMAERMRRARPEPGERLSPRRESPKRASLMAREPRTAPSTPSAPGPPRTPLNMAAASQATAGQVNWAALWARRAEDNAEPPTRQVALLQSVFEGRPPTLLFNGPVDPHRGAGRLLAYEDDGLVAAKMYYCHTKETHEYNAVLNTLENAGLERATRSSQKWSICWGGSRKPEAVNHFPASEHLGRKDLLWRSVRKMQQRLQQTNTAGSATSIMPNTFVLPEDARNWEVARKMSPTALWIWKPANSSCGRGIRLLRSVLEPQVEEALLRRPGVVQSYVDRPLLIDGYKFDLRLYVVVTSFDPLKVYLNSEGLVRLATEKYSNSPTTLHQRTMHLTNYSVNKKSQAYVKNLDDGLDCGEEEEAAGQEEQERRDGEGGERQGGDWDKAGAASRCGEDEGDARQAHKWPLRQLREHFAAQGLDYELMMDRIKDLVIRSLISVDPVVGSSWHQGANYSGLTSSQAIRGLGPNQCCFEIYGFDVLVDLSLQPWLLEVNTFPSLSSSSPLDKRIKTQLVADALTLVGLQPFDHRLVRQAAREERAGQAVGLLAKAQGRPRSQTIQSLQCCTLSDLGYAEWHTILDAHDEYMRRGSLERIFPMPDTDRRYTSMFLTPRYANVLLAKFLAEGGEALFERPGQLGPCVPRLASCEAC